VKKAKKRNESQVPENWETMPPVGFFAFHQEVCGEVAGSTVFASRCSISDWHLAIADPTLADTGEKALLVRMVIRHDVQRFQAQEGGATRSGVLGGSGDDARSNLRSSVPPMTEVTSDISLMRFHGRNRDNWEKQGIGPAERFNYHYSEEDLQEWVPKIKDLASRTKQCHVLFNNCYEDKAVVNARQISLMLN
jgi:uncharacterized protein YecE (DUF72 family)